jgi:hypothetical protein
MTNFGIFHLALVLSGFWSIIKKYCNKQKVIYLIEHGRPDKEKPDRRASR